MAKSDILNPDLAAIRKYGNLELLARQMVEGFITGLHRSPYHGFSVEFAEHKRYDAGESTRHIDWKVYNRTDKLYTKRYQEETNLRCQIIIDTSSSMYYPVENKGKLTFSIIAAAAMANLLTKQRDAVGVCTFSDQVELMTPIRSTPSHVHNLMVQLQQELGKESGQRRTNASGVFHQLADKIHRRSLIVIFSDMFEDLEESEKLFAALQHLKHNKHEIILFHTTDKATEKEFEFADRPYEFVDLETGQKVKVRSQDVKKHYKATMAKYYHDLKLKCAQYKINFVEADIAMGIDEILLPFLVQRQKLR